MKRAEIGKKFNCIFLKKKKNKPKAKNGVLDMWRRASVGVARCRGDVQRFQNFDTLKQPSTVHFCRQVDWNLILFFLTQFYIIFGFLNVYRFCLCVFLLTSAFAFDGIDDVSSWTLQQVWWPVLYEST